jgi:hypothetical protein
MAEQRYTFPRVRTAQEIRAVLLAIATVANRAGLRSGRDQTQTPALVVLASARRITEVAPMTSSRRR